MTLREKLIVLRDKAGISQMALAHQLGVSRQAVSRWESGDTTPSMDKLKALAKIYGVSLDWLCSDKCEFSENTEIERERKDAQEQIRNEELPVCKEKKFGKHRKLLIAIIGTIIAALIFTLLNGLGFLFQVICVAHIGSIFLDQSLEIRTGIYKCCVCQLTMCNVFCFPIALMVSVPM